MSEIPHCKKMLDAIEKLLEGKASEDVQSYTIAGRSLTKLSFPELYKLRKRYIAEYAVFERKQKAKNGQVKRPPIIMRFS